MQRSRIGGNTFNGTTTITNSGSEKLYLGNSNPDIFATDVTVNNTGTNSTHLAYNSIGNQFNGNTTLNASGSGATNIITVATQATASAPSPEPLRRTTQEQQRTIEYFLLLTEFARSMETPF